jgi:hypothetical protein
MKKIFSFVCHIKDVILSRSAENAMITEYSIYLFSAEQSWKTRKTNLDAIAILLRGQRLKTDIDIRVI